MQNFLINGIHGYSQYFVKGGMAGQYLGDSSLAQRNHALAFGLVKNFMAGGPGHDQLLDSRGD